MRIRLATLALATGVTVVLPSTAAAAVPTPVPTRTGTIAVAGAGTCGEGSAEGRLTWTPGSLVRSVRVTAVVVDDEPGGWGNFEYTVAVYTAYSGTTVVDSMEVDADNSVAAISFDLTGALTPVDRVEVSICWFPLVAIGFDPVRTCVVDSRRIS